MTMSSNGGGELTREERLQIMLTPEELAVLDDFRFSQRMPSRAAAVRELLRLGLAAVGLEPAAAGVKSGQFGVIGGRADGPPAKPERSSRKGK
jgi:hypothetical protein